MDELRDKLHTELMSLAEQPLSPATLDLIDKLTHSIKSIDTIMVMKYGDRKCSKVKSKLEEIQKDADPETKAMIGEWLKQMG